MRLTFTKLPGKYDRLDIVTIAGARPPVQCPKQGIIPHDMVHYAVEAEVAARGFLGAVADGAEAGFGDGDFDGEAGGVERLVETVQAEAWSGSVYHDDAFLDLYRVTCEARGDAPLAIDGALLAAIRARLAELTACWAAVPVGGSLTLELAT
ncbi:hypothetical protein IP88_16430 [alpha proteobacterium AAP81b]|nr:hypothetical protein IP88_16430 [alpha proteobacterium AAP81b]